MNRIHDLKINVPNQPIPAGGTSRNWFTHEVYGYDAMNRLTSVQRDEEPAMSDQFGYYLNGELNSADYGLHWVTDHWENPAHAVDYNLDRAGNRTGTAGVTADSTAYPYAPNALNQYTNANGGTVGNGLNNEIASYDGKTYSYLNDTHLAQVSYGDVSGTHLYQLGYDALGRCVRRSTGGSSTAYYIYDGERPIFEFDSGGGTPSTNVYGRGIDEIIARSNHGAGQYPMQDREGSVILVTGGDGTILESYRYDAFGGPTIKKPDGTVITTGASLINNRFLFTGREYASQYGFYEYRARAYHPGMGRFMSEDPKGFVHRAALGKEPDKWSFNKSPSETELNLFRYCSNAPEDFTDPMGLDDVVIAFPDYMNGVGMGVKMNLGHAGLLTIDNKTGAARYYEYGRYVTNDGEVRSLTPETKIKINSDGTVNRDSVRVAMREIAHRSGQDGRAEGAYVRTTQEQQQKIDAYAQDREGQNNVEGRQKYEKYNHSCNDFPREALSAGGIALPGKQSSYPGEEIKNLQGSFEPISIPK